MSTLEEAKIALKSVETEQGLIEVLKTVDVISQNTVDDAKTLLYSGVGQLPEEIISDNSIRLLDNTAAAKLIQSKDFTDTLAVVFDFNTNEANNFLYKTNGGAWDTISERFVKATTHHELNTFIGDRASAERTFFKTELSAARENDKITHIDGVEKKLLFEELDKLETPQHQINYFKTNTYAREEVAKALKMDNPLELSHTKMHAFLNSNTPQAHAISNQIDTHQIELFTKAEVSNATGIPNDKISDDEIKTFLSQESDSSKSVVDKIENHVKELSEYNPHIKNFDVSTHGKYAIVGAVAGTILGTQEADASSLHLNAHLDKDKFDTLSSTEQIGAEIGAGFNAINAIQAGEEFKSGANKSATTLLDTNAYKQGLDQATDAWKPSATKEVVKLGAMDSAKVAGKSFLKKLPLIGLGAGIVFGISRAMDGDWKGAGMEVASGAFSLVPGWGTAASVGMDAALLEKDTALLSHGAEKLLGKENQEIFTQSEDNHTTIEPKQNLNLSRDVEKDGFEYNENGMLIFTGDNVVSIDDIELQESTQIDTTQKAQEKIAELFPEFQINDTVNRQQNQRVEEPKEESIIRFDTSSQAPYIANDTIAYSEEDTLPKNHRPMNLQNNLTQQPLEENQLRDEEQFRQAEQRIYENIAETYGSSNDYGNDRGMEID